jgi:UDP-3-O-[3-hydroxymyristoyl] N-acetylglucosamine deacetylase
MRFQQTIQREIFISGSGLHTGREIHMYLRPAPENTGIVFIRSDESDSIIRARVDYVSDTTFATTLSHNGVRVGTVEHLLAALSGMCIDNVIIELDGPEVPILDGSAIPFVERIREVGIRVQTEPVSYIKILRPVIIEDGLGQIAVVPYNGFRITYRLFYTHAALGEQKLGIDITMDSFIRELAPARTYGFLRDVEKLRSKGLARGGSLENAIVVGETKILNGSKLRFRDEFVRHKILDAVGDFSLLGMPLIGHIIANKSGHTLHIKLLKKILQTRNAWEALSPSSSISSDPEFVAQIQVS